MTSEADFVAAYGVLTEETSGFTDVSVQTLSTALDREPKALAPLRMILGFTTNELAVAMSLADPETPTSGSRVKNSERRPRPVKTTTARATFIAAVARTVLALMQRDLLPVPEASAEVFHSKLDKRDTRQGWAGVVRDARDGVPYSALLYQRYIGGTWLVVQAAYSEAKGDALLERPLSALLERERVPYYRSRSGASGATQTAVTFGINPGPDVLIPEQSPTVVIETKVGEDGGTVRDKAARIGRLAEAAKARGLVTCAVIDGKGWRERPQALVDVVIATGGRTYSLSTLDQLLGVPKIAALRGTAREPGDLPRFSPCGGASRPSGLLPGFWMPGVDGFGTIGLPVGCGFVRSSVIAFDVTAPLGQSA
jgi:hypothetical protein